jgi:hypothetical protein
VVHAGARANYTLPRIVRKVAHTVSKTPRHAENSMPVTSGE